MDSPLVEKTPPASLSDATPTSKPKRVLPLLPLLPPLPPLLPRPRSPSTSPPYLPPSNLIRRDSSLPSNNRQLDNASPSPDSSKVVVPTFSSIQERARPTSPRSGRRGMGQESGFTREDPRSSCERRWERWSKGGRLRRWEFRWGRLVLECRPSWFL